MTNNLVVMVSLKWTIWLNCEESNLSNKVKHANIHKCKHLYPHVWCWPTLNGPNSLAGQWADGLGGVKYCPVIYIKLRISCHAHLGIMYVLISCLVLCQLEQKQWLRGMKHLYEKHTDALIWLFWVLWIYWRTWRHFFIFIFFFEFLKVFFGPFGLLIGKLKTWTGNRIKERGSDMQQRAPGWESNPDPLQWWQSLCTWDACSTNWAKRAPEAFFSCSPYTTSQLSALHILQIFK